MLDYLISLMDDANDFSCTSVKASHGVLLCRMEQGKIKDFRILWLLIGSEGQMLKHMYQMVMLCSFCNIKVTKSMPCVYFNQGSSLQAKSPETRRVLYKHMCVMLANNKSFQTLQLLILMEFELSLGKDDKLLHATQPYLHKSADWYFYH